MINFTAMPLGYYHPKPNSIPTHFESEIICPRVLRNPRKPLCSIKCQNCLLQCYFPILIIGKNKLTPNNKHDRLL